MIISRIDREALYDAHFAISTTRFPRDVPALCFQLGQALNIITVPTISDVDASVASLEAAPDGLRSAWQQIDRSTKDLEAAWSGEAAEAARTALTQLQDTLQTLSTAIGSELAPEIDRLRFVARHSAETVQNARLRMMRAFSLTPQLQQSLTSPTTRQAALFALIKTEAHDGLGAVVGAIVDFDQACYAFIEDVQRARHAIRSERPARTGGFLA